MNKNILVATLLAGSLITSANASEAEKLFDTKCAMCHIKTAPKLENQNSMVAPAIMGVMRHVKMSYPTKENAVKFMVDYIRFPSAEKAICQPAKIKKYGLMPSQKDSVTEEEAKIISEWLFDNFPPANFVGMNRQRMMARGGTAQAGRGMMNRPAFEDFDKDGDGMISRDEFNVFRASRMASRATSASAGQGNQMAMGRGAANRPTFEMFDADGNGVVTKDELTSFRQKRQAQQASKGMPMRNAGNAPAFEKMDADGNGELTKEEFDAFRAKNMIQKGMTK